LGFELWSGPRGGRDVEGRLKLGLRFADGSTVTNVGGWPEQPMGYGHGRDPDRLPDGPVLLEPGGGGGGARKQEYWVWRLPPAGELALVCEWQSRGVDLTVTTLDADAIREAAGRAVPMWTN
jgi:hypothetical protein